MSTCLSSLGRALGSSLYTALYGDVPGRSPRNFLRVGSSQPSMPNMELGLFLRLEPCVSGSSALKVDMEPPKDSSPSQSWESPSDSSLTYLQRNAPFHPKPCSPPPPPWTVQPHVFLKEPTLCDTEGRWGSIFWMPGNCCSLPGIIRVLESGHQGLTPFLEWAVEIPRAVKITKSQ